MRESHHIGCPVLLRELKPDGSVGRLLVDPEAVCTCEEREPDPGPDRKPQERWASSPAIGLTAQDIEDVQEAWQREDEHRNRFYTDERFRHYEMSPAAKILKATFDGVLYKHHPLGLPSIHCDDYGDEP